MRHGRRAGIAARVFLTLGALLPYWRFLSFRVVFITDDFFASDIFNGEFPGRVLIGRILRGGELPIWTSQLCSGIPLVGTPADPLGLAAFALLPPAPALDLYVLVLLLIAAHGAYALALRFGADRIGAVLAGIAFAGCGYFATQLKHLSIVATVAWLPAGLAFLDGALRAETPRPSQRGVMMGLFGLVFAQQALAGFPQSAYICALVYGAFALFRAIGDRRHFASWRVSAGLLAGVGIAALLGAAAGAVVLLPLSALGNISDRIGTLSYEWSTLLAYWPRNALMFLFPYINGDIANATYQGPLFFWEDYSYVGLATFLLAIYGAFRDRRRPVTVFAILMTLVAYFCVLGRATPVFHAIYLMVPGMKLFRFPTRFLIVVELGIALLAALGLTRLRKDIERAWSPPSRVPVLVVIGICAVTAIDLLVQQPRQNPTVPADQWLAPPATVGMIQADTPQPRTFTPRHRDAHRLAFSLARGWANVTPYYQLRDTLEPNTGGALWGTASADCYSGIAPRWYVDVWGDHNREASVAGTLAALNFRDHALESRPAFANMLRAFGVTHVLSIYPQAGSGLVPLAQTPNAQVYRVPGAARVRVVRSARVVQSEREAALRLLDPRFDPDREVLLHDAAVPAAPAAPSGIATAAVVRDHAGELVVDTDSPFDGYLLIADTYYPGWTARVDGTETPLFRANLSVRAVAITAGRHEVRLTYEPPAFRRGLAVTAVSLFLLTAWTAAAIYADRRARRYRSNPIDPQNPITT